MSGWRRRDPHPPSPREEAWRWSDLSALAALAEQDPHGGVVDLAPYWIGCGGPRLLFVDGLFQPA
jgi:Fe-S cluster assembly protein SufD